MDTTYSFGYWVKRRRKALDITQQTLANCSGCATVTLKKIEADARRPSATLAARLADCLGIAPAERAQFLAMATGERPADALALANRPVTALPDHLPRPVNPFLGRETERNTLLAMLTQPAIRLITVVGPGGMGKTRLSLAAADVLQQQTPRPFADGIVFVDLTAVAAPDAFFPALARALHFPLDTTRREARSPDEQLRDFLAQKEALLLLDNFEQLLPLAAWLDNLLQAAPRLKLLVTSRERLGLTSEHIYPIPAMTYPIGELETAGAAQHDAVRLFVAAAQRVRPTFALTVENETAVTKICRLAGGLPLALELAAGWMDTLSPAAIAAELQSGLEILHSDLQNLAARHQNMRLILAAGWERLPAEQQAAFARLCLFAGGFSREAASAVAGVSLPQLAHFVSKTFVAAEPEQERYTIHELLRQFGLEQLRRSGDEAAAWQAYGDYYLALAETANAHLRRSGQEAWLARLDAETDNLHAALTWALTRPGGDAAAQLAIALGWYWRIRSRPAEAGHWLAQALAAAPPQVELLAGLHYHAGSMAWMRGEMETAVTHNQSSLALWQSLGAAGATGSGYAWHNQGMVADAQQDHERARDLFTQSAGLLAAQGDAWGAAFATGWRGVVGVNMGDLTEAARDLAASAAQFQLLGDDWARGLMLGTLARLQFLNGRLDEARELIETAQSLEPALTHWHSRGDRLQLLAEIAVQQGALDRARGYYAAALQLYTNIGNRRLADHVQAVLTTLPPD